MKFDGEIARIRGRRHRALLTGNIDEVRRCDADLERLQAAPVVVWCYQHGRTIVDCYAANGTITVERECETDPAKVRGFIFSDPDERLETETERD